MMFSFSILDQRGIRATLGFKMNELFLGGSVRRISQTEVKVVVASRHGNENHLEAFFSWLTMLFDEGQLKLPLDQDGQPLGPVVSNDDFDLRTSAKKAVIYKILPGISASYADKSELSADPDDAISSRSTGSDRPL
jgi:hypothetical protein